MKITSASVVQICPVAPGWRCGDGIRAAHVIALALIEIAITESDGSCSIGRDIAAVVAGFGDESDSIRLEFPSLDADVLDNDSLFYLSSALGDFQTPVSLRYVGEAFG